MEFNLLKEVHEHWNTIEIVLVVLAGIVIFAVGNAITKGLNSDRE